MEVERSGKVEHDIEVESSVSGYITSLHPQAAPFQSVGARGCLSVGLRRFETARPDGAYLGRTVTSCARPFA